MTLDLKYIIENLDTIVGFFTPASAFMATYRLYAHYAKKMAIFSAETVIYSFLINMVANILYPGISFVVLHIICLVLGGFGSGTNSTRFMTMISGMESLILNMGALSKYS